MIDISAIEAVVESFRDEHSSDDGVLESVRSILEACAMAQHPDTCPASRVFDLLNTELGFGCWLDDLGDAIQTSKISETQKAYLHGALGMGSWWLLSANHHNQ